MSERRAQNKYDSDYEPVLQQRLQYAKIQLKMLRMTLFDVQRTNESLAISLDPIALLGRVSSLLHDDARFNALRLFCSLFILFLFAVEKCTAKMESNCS